MRLRTVLLFTYLVVLLTPLGVLFGVSELYIQRTLHEDALAYQKDFSGLLVNNLQSFFDLTRLILARVSVDMDEFSTSAEENEFLTERIHQISFVSTIVRLDGEGRILFSVPSRPSLHGISLARSFSLEELPRNEIVFGSAGISFFSGQATVVAVVSLSEGKGGYLVFELALDGLNTQFTLENSPMSHRIEITDKVGTVVVSPDAKDVLERKNIFPMVRQDGYGRITRGGETWLTFVKTLPSTNWKILTSFQEDILFRGYRLLRLTLVIIAVSVGLLLTLIVLVIIRSVSHSLSNLQIRINELEKSSNPSEHQPLHFQIKEYEELDERFRKLAEVVKRRESDIRSFYQRFDALVSNMPGIVFRVAYDENGARNLDYISPQAKEILGVEYEKIYELSEGIEELILPDDLERFIEAERFSRKTGTQFFWEGQILTAKGILHIRINSKLHYQDKTQVWDGVVTDISNEVRLQEALIQTEKMTMIGGLAAGMAHEIFNPISAILQSTEALEIKFFQAPSAQNLAKTLGLDWEKLTEFFRGLELGSSLKFIRESGQRAGHIIRDMLEFSRKDQEEKEEVLLTDLINSAVNLVRTSLEEKERKAFSELEILIREPAHPIKVRCVPTQIEQVFINLIKNAFDAITQKKNQKHTFSPRIGINILGDDQTVIVEVTDNGLGISDADKRRIFEPFFTTKPVGKGTGLGLSVSYFIVVRNHGGTLDVESRLHWGTKFILKLPLVQAE